jgi:hypothetical protein
VVDSDHQDRHRAYQRTPGELALPPSYLLLPGIARSPSSRVGRRAPPHHLSPELVPVNPRKTVTTIIFSMSRRFGNHQ